VRQQFGTWRHRDLARSKYPGDLELAAGTNPFTVGHLEKEYFGHLELTNVQYTSV
jgi:hypothetical protein